MTKERYAQAVRDGEPRYYIDFKTATTVARAFEVAQVSDTKGPYLRLNGVKRTVAKMRAERCVFRGNDLGRWYAFVKIRVEGAEQL